MKKQSFDEPMAAYSSEMTLLETTDTNHADNFNACMLQVFLNTLANRQKLRTFFEDESTEGLLARKVLANATAVEMLGEKQLRNIYAGTTDMTAGESELPTGDIYIYYE